MTDPDDPNACEPCRGSGRIAYGSWGARPPKKTCPDCNGSGASATESETTP